MTAVTRLPVGEWRGELFAIEARLRRIGAMLIPRCSIGRSERMQEELGELHSHIEDFLRRHATALPEETSSYFRTAVREIETMRRRHHMPVQEFAEAGD
jgi:hypothetical protein